jgi:hypothetical protein
MCLITIIYIGNRYSANGVLTPERLTADLKLAAKKEAQCSVAEKGPLSRRRKPDSGEDCGGWLEAADAVQPLRSTSLSGNLSSAGVSGIAEIRAWMA